MSKLVYLAGPISGLSYGEATSWRQQAIKELQPLKGLSPMRGKDYLLDELKIDDFYDDKALSTMRAITSRDRFDCQRADVVLFNLIGSTKVSIGTMIELGWADSMRIPKVVCMEDDNIHSHAIVNELIDFRVYSLEEGIEITKKILIEEML